MSTQRTVALSSPRRVRRWWASAATPQGFRRLTLCALTGLVLIVPSGAFVRLTGSGLGCPDWPLCNGGIVPAAAAHPWIEFTNRLLSGLVMVVCVVALVAALRLPEAPRALRAWAVVPALATVGQVPLGAVTVAFDLHPLLVASHFLLSMLGLAGGTVLALQANDHARGVARRRSRQGLLAAVALAALAGVVVTGVLVTAAGPHSGDAAAIRRYGNLADAASIHVRFVIAFTLATLLLGLLLWRRGGVTGLTRRLGVALLPTIALQIGLGEYQYRHRLPWQVVVAHVSVAGILWALGVALAWLVWRPLEAEEEAPSYRRREAAV